MPFSKQTLDFLIENRLHDSREWFGQHKNSYNRFVITPFKELVAALPPTMLKLDDQFTTEPRVDRTISRVWRDTRYSHDPALYRDNMWLIFKRGDRMHGSDYPGCYFEISAQGFVYGCGFYHASTGYMNTLRSLVLAEDPAFSAAQQAFSRQKVFVMEGECYKRPHFADKPPAQSQWLERRNISFNARCTDFDLLFSDHLAEHLIAGFQKLAPIYRFLLHAATQELQNQAARNAQQARGIDPHDMDWD